MRKLLDWRQRGVAAVEFTIALSLLLIILLGAADFGRSLYAKIVMQGSAAAGAQYGVRVGGAYTDTTGIRAAALADTSGLTGVTVTPTYRCFCSDGVSVGCNSHCGLSTPSDPTPYIVLTVPTAYTFVPVAPGFPGLPSSVAVAGTASMRAQ